MIKKIAELLGRKIFIPKTEVVETKPTPLQTKEEPKPEYIGVPAPVETPTDSWFTDVSVQSIKTEKQITHEQMLEEAARREEENRKEEKEPKNIHQQMYDRVTKYWGTWQEEHLGGSENFQSGPGGWNSGNGMGQFKS
jgi:hypothetical protein